VEAPVPAPATAEEAPAAEAAAAEAPVAEAKPHAPADAVPAPSETPAETATPAPAEEAKPAAIAEAELKLAELAALLPVAEQAMAASSTTQAEPAPDSGLHTHAPDLVPRGFVPPAPMSTRGSPTVVEVPVRKGSGGWVAATLVMGLVAVALAGLITAWRFVPERLPAQLRANTVLNLIPIPQPPPQPRARPKPPPFDE
jgi:hypothetical protein